MNQGLQIACGPRDDNNNRSVVAKLNGHPPHRDCFDTDRAFGRQKFREAVIRKFGLTEAAHEFLENKIVAAADMADSPDNISEEIVLTTLANVESKRPEWVWPGRIARGAASTFEGNPGDGKSTLAYAIAAVVTKGGLFPDEPPNIFRQPEDVLIMTPEDSVEYTIRGRLDAAGADVHRCHHMATIRGLDGEERMIQLGRDIAHIEKVVRARKVGMIIIDPVTAFLDDGCNYNSDSDVRKALSPILRMADSTRCSLLWIRHLNKRSGGNVLYRGGGSIAFVGLARSAFIIAPTQDNPEARVLACMKSNLAKFPPSLMFHIEDVGESSKVVWDGESEQSASELFQHENPGGGGGNGRGGKLERAKAIILEVLAGGPRGESDVMAAMEAASIGRSTYWSARKELGVQSEKLDFNGGWLLSLPATEEFGTEY